MMKKVTFWMMAICLLCSGCSLLGPVKSKPITTYALMNPPVVTTEASHSGGKVLQVSEVTANTGYTTEDMMYMRERFELGHFSKHRWISPPAELFTPLVVEQLAHSGCFKAVVGSAQSGSSDLSLNVQLLVLRQEFFATGSQERLAVQATLNDTAGGRIIAQRRFERVEPTSQDTPYGGVIAANRAAAEVLSDLVAFTCRGARS